MARFEPPLATPSSSHLSKGLWDCEEQIVRKVSIRLSDSETRAEQINLVSSEDSFS